MFARTFSTPAKHNTDVEFIETFKKEFFPGVPEQSSQADLTFPDRSLFEVTVCGKPWKRETEPLMASSKVPKFALWTKLKAREGKE